MRTLLLLLAGVMSFAASSFSAPDQPSGVAGVITIAPVHGGPIRLGVPNSKALGNTEFTITQDEKVVATFTTNEDGTFRVALPPGHYTVTKNVGSKGIGRYGPFEVFVTAGEMTKVEWNCDSGMR